MGLSWFIMVYQVYLKKLFIYRFIIIFTGQNWGERAERWSGKSSDRLQRKRILFDNPILTIMAKDDLWIKYRAMMSYEQLTIVIIHRGNLHRIIAIDYSDQL